MPVHVGPRWWPPVPPPPPSSTPCWVGPQVASPQRIPATVAPTLLLSPSVFSQAKAAGPPQDGGPAPGPPAPRPPAPEEAPVLSRGQLQDTLLHLIRVRAQGRVRVGSGWGQGQGGVRVRVGLGWG